MQQRGSLESELYITLEKIKIKISILITEIENYGSASYHFTGKEEPICFHQFSISFPEGELVSQEVIIWLIYNYIYIIYIRTHTNIHVAIHFPSVILLVVWVVVIQARHLKLWLQIQNGSHIHKCWLIYVLVNQTTTVFKLYLHKAPEWQCLCCMKMAANLLVVFLRAVLNPPCSGWMLFINIQYAKWPLYGLRHGLEVS